MAALIAIALRAVTVVATLAVRLVTGPTLGLGRSTPGTATGATGPGDSDTVASWPTASRGLLAGASERLIDALVALGATAAFLQTYALPVRWNRGPEGRWWVSVRTGASRLLGTLVDERAGPRPITEGEYAGRLPLSLREAEQLLWAAGFVRNPFARHKHRDGDPELGSWAARESPLARRQLHVMLYPGDDGIDVYAHEEPSNARPALGSDHFDGDGQNVAAGVERARAILPLDVSDATADPPAGPWNAALDR